MGEEGDNTDWTTSLLDKRDGADKQARQALGKINISERTKRRGGENGSEEGGRKKKKPKYDKIGEDWGMTDSEEGGQQNFLYSGLEGVTIQKNIRSPRKKSKGKKERALESAAKTSQKITNWTKPINSGQHICMPEEEGEKEVKSDVRDTLNVLQSSELSEVSMTGMEVILYNGEFAESQVRNRMRRIKINFDRMYPVECVRYLQAIMCERVSRMNEAKSSRNLPTELIVEESIRCNQVYPVANLKALEVKNIQVTNKAKVVEMKKKVWTKLENGLYAWRRRRVPKSNLGRNFSSTLAERGSQSAKATKRKANDNLGFGSEERESLERGTTPAIKKVKLVL